jgi:hypothetical protein
MNLVIGTLEAKIEYLEEMVQKYNDIPEMQEEFKKDIRDFRQVIDIVQLYISLKNNK